MHKVLQKKYQKPQTDEETKIEQNSQDKRPNQLPHGASHLRLDPLESSNLQNEQSQLNNKNLDSNTKLATTLPGTNSVGNNTKTRFKKTLAENICYVATYNAYKPSCRVTSDCFPATKKLQKSINLPLAAVIVPYVSLYTPESFPLIKRGTGNEIFRCEPCRAYVNPFTIFLESGKKFRCNICNTVSPTPEIHYAEIDPSTQDRVDRNERADLCTGAYEIAAGSDYMNGPPVPPTFVFLVDVSKNAVASGLLDNFVNVMVDLISHDKLPGKQGAQIAIFTYDDNLHFYLLKPNLKSPQLFVLDPKEFESALFPEDVFANVADYKALFISLLSSLPRYQADNQSNGSLSFSSGFIFNESYKSQRGKTFYFAGFFSRCK